MSALRRLIVSFSVFGAVLVVAACDRGNPVAPASTPAPATNAAPAVDAPKPLAVAAVKFGRYVMPKTYEIGGVGTSFKAADPLFATVQLEGSAPSATVQVKITDAAGQAVVEQSRIVQPKNRMKVNFTLVKADSGLLAPGTYSAETQLDGKSVDQTQLVIQ